MGKKLGFFGIGPWLALIGTVYFFYALIISIDHRADFRMVFVSRTADETAGMILFALGFLVFLAAHAWLWMAWHKDQLATTGLYRLCRHPMYATWILIMLPAMGLMAHSWLVLLNVLVTYAAFKLLIRREDRKLEAAFGPEYLDYRSRTNEILPWFWPTKTPPAGV